MMRQVQSAALTSAARNIMSRQLATLLSQITELICFSRTFWRSCSSTGLKRAYKSSREAFAVSFFSASCKYIIIIQVHFNVLLVICCCRSLLKLIFRIAKTDIYASIETMHFTVEFILTGTCKTPEQYRNEKSWKIYSTDWVRLTVYLPQLLTSWILSEMFLQNQHAT